MLYFLLLDQSAMALSGFEIAVGGIASIPVLGGLVLLGYKAFGEKNLDTSKLKPKKPAVAEKKAKREAKQGTSKIEEDNKSIPLDQVITLDHLTNPDKK